MARQNEHSRILADAAGKVLKPQGFWRKGRSRIWLADHGFWLAMVEFQPSDFVKGSYLNVGAHWLWHAMPDTLSFNYMLDARQKKFAKFSTAQQFAPLADHLAKEAADQNSQLVERIGGIQTAAALLLSQHEYLERNGRAGGWAAFDAAVANGISGDFIIAQALFQNAQDSLLTWRPDLRPHLGPYENAFKQKAVFRDFIARRVDSARAVHGLDPADHGLWMG